MDFAWAGIVRHQTIRYRASLDDPTLTEYWAWRRRNAPLPINNTRRRLLQVQAGRCAICKGTLHPIADQPQLPHQSERWLAANRATIIPILAPTAGTDEAALRLIHADSVKRSGTALLPARHQGLLEPDAVKVAHPVLSSVERSKALDLSDPSSSRSRGIPAWHELANA